MIMVILKINFVGMKNLGLVMVVIEFTVYIRYAFGALFSRLVSDFMDVAYSISFIKS